MRDEWINVTQGNKVLFKYSVDVDSCHFKYAVLPWKVAGHKIEHISTLDNKVLENAVHAVIKFIQEDTEAVHRRWCYSLLEKIVYEMADRELLGDKCE